MDANFIADLSLVVSCPADPESTTVLTDRPSQHCKLSDWPGLKHTDLSEQQAPCTRTWSFNLPAHSSLARLRQHVECGRHSDAVVPGAPLSQPDRRGRLRLGLPAFAATLIDDMPFAPALMLASCCVSPRPFGSYICCSSAGQADPAVSRRRRHLGRGHRLLPQQIVAPARGLPCTETCNLLQATAGSIHHAALGAMCPKHLMPEVRNRIRHRAADNA